MMKIAASAVIRHHIPTMPRSGSTQGVSAPRLTGIVADGSIIHISNLDLLDASYPRVDGGFLPLVLQRSYRTAAVNQSPTPGTRHPMDLGLQASHESTSEQGCRRRSRYQS